MLDKEFEGRGVKVIRYADDIILLARSIRAAERLLGPSIEHLEKKLSLKVNTEAASVYSIRNFGFLVLQWKGTETVHISEFTSKARRNAKKLKWLTFRSHGRKLDTVFEKEAVEVAENEGRKPKEIRNARMASTPKRQHSKRLLDCHG